MMSRARARRLPTSCRMRASSTFRAAALAGRLRLAAAERIGDLAEDAAETAGGGGFLRRLLGHLLALGEELVGALGIDRVVVLAAQRACLDSLLALRLGHRPDATGRRGDQRALHERRGA